MARRPGPAPALSGSPEDTEAQFYDALQRADLEALMALWSDDEDIVCVHPGGACLVGAVAIRAGFAAIFANGGVPVQPERVRRVPMLGGEARHVVERVTARDDNGQVQEGFVLATNVYVKTAQGWRIAMHHASPALPDDLQGLAAAASREGPATLH